MKKVLVFPCGSEIGLEIYRSLEWSKDFEIYGASSVNDHGRFVYNNYIHGIPFVNNVNFINSINKVIQQYKIDFIFPSHDSVLLKLIQNKNKIKATIIGSQLKTCEICRSKKKTYSFFKNILKTPHIYNLNDKLLFPIFLKPEIGQGSKGALIANDLEEVKLALKKDPTLLILEYLPGKEYTVDCFTNSSGELLFAQGRERRRIVNGISVNSFPVEKLIFFEIAKKINKSLNFRGVWFFQLKEDEKGILTLLEIAPRVAGTMALPRTQGINLPLLSLYDFMNTKVSITKNDFSIEIDRALYAKYKTNIKYENVYIDLDDTLIFKERINTVLISFIYQCLNKGKKIFLITKHKENVKKTLNIYKISHNIFSEIINLPITGNKYKFVRKNSIFIDDSFSERQSVINKNKVPVFSVNEIECLLD
ncbi:MAG: Carbamoylphosphate synthase large subunit short form [Candidatus Roizmanbacteria bacterium GW2011_GWA2_35_19]|uniref:Carbamoylphosphate synthase large subunit short form n=2 Tax=Candidatus Roizmaniibacteriota TaxID=1752723 RepID=A0A0G0EY17_9BACT|nr:MAG: Carbamoylphosphate synthase large subunit short form [Candidatus Roizmanbacteria bacterium GW2011_GWC2_35_12]KKP72072.1 MAG: Carbamoylphosphate synthase large subunit short form [Candidatus Roizmanbacteria bacterium GW2011_GWA2_35_19]